ncbi:MAG: hypothetical protein RSD19_02755 [Oscillospiraceae bacterium]
MHFFDYSVAGIWALGLCGFGLCCFGLWTLDFAALGFGTKHLHFSDGCIGSTEIQEAGKAYPA